MNFQNKIVYITGGSQGIGLAAAQKVAAQGADVVVFARREDVLKTAVDSIRPHTIRDGQRVESRALNVAEHVRVSAVMEDMVRDFGVPDVLLNCAGRAYPHRFEDVSYSQFEESLRINLGGCWNTVHALLPHMKRKGGGYIVNTSSIAGLIGVFGFTDYCASKFAVVGFSEALRNEVKPHHIMVSVLCPPDTDTPGFATENTTKPPETMAISQTAKLMSADTVADALLRGMAKRQPLIVPGFDGRLTVLLKRMAPGLLERYLDGIVRKVQQKGGVQGGSV